MTDWKDISGYEGIYQVSSTGKVRSMDRIDAAGRKLKGRDLAEGGTPHGYKQFTLTKDGSPKTYYTHRLVADAFHGASDLHVNHINGDKADNRAANLEWVNRSENTLHGVAMGLIHQLRGENGRFASA